MKKKYSLIAILFFTVIVIFSHVVHHRNYISHKQQVKLTQDITQAKYDDVTPEFYNNLEVEIPSLTVTTIPIKALKAIYIQTNEPRDSLKKSIDLFHESIKDNPFLMFSEGNLSQTYYALRKFDSAYYYARKSFLGIPKNAVHFAMIAKLYANFGNYDSIVKSFNIVNSGRSNKNISSRADIYRIYFASMINFIDQVDDSLKNSVIRSAKEAKNYFLKDKDLQLLADYVIEGKNKVDIAVLNAENGSKLLSEKKYLEGINSIEQALLVRKNNMGYIQTIGLAYHNLGDHKKAIENLEILEKNNISLDPISLYVKGLSHYYLRDKIKSCKYLLKASRFGLENAETAYNSLCKF